MKKIEIIFDSSEAKKHSIRFNTSQKDAAVDSIYIKNLAFEGSVPKKVKITLEEA